MKLKSTLAVSLFAIAAVLSLNASAAPDAPADAKTEKAKAKKPMKRHSHMEEKTGIASTAEQTTQEKNTAPKTNPALDKTKHFHPRDGK